MNRLRNGNEIGAADRPDPMRGTASSDAELVHAARRGEKRAFVEIVGRHQAMVCGIALGILGDFAASEDAGQEAFLTAWRKFHELREPSSLRAWLGQIARNAALGHLRRKRRHDALDHTTELADQSAPPDEIVAKEEEATLVRESLAQLSETYRMPLILYYREDQSVRAVAEALGISEDAVKQRLARGREMLRDRVSGLIETVLKRSGPTPIFTMTIAAAIGALAAPAAMAGSVFSATAAATSATSTATSSTSLLTAMSTSKALLITATAIVTVICIPVGYNIRSGHNSQATNNADAQVAAAKATPQKAPPSFENSAIFAEWKRLHDTYGTTAEAMPALYDAIASVQDTFRRRAFRTALIAEWVQLDPANGFVFFLGQRDTSQRDQFFLEWLALEASAAVTGLMASGNGWQQVARNSLIEIARKVPSRIPEIVEQLPALGNSSGVLQAYAIFAEKDLNSARTAAEAMTGPNRGQALGGVAQAWAKTRIDDAIAWAKTLPAGIDRDEIIRAALIGKASADPVGALEGIGMVPPGGVRGQSTSSTGARVLRAAANADYDATVAWIAAHPKRLGREDVMGIADAITDRLNTDPVAFLNRHAGDNSLICLLPAIKSVILNEAGGQKNAMWEWLKTQPDTETTKLLKREVLTAAGYQDPALAMSLVKDFPATAEGEEQIQSLVSSLYNGGSMLHRIDKLLEQAPERLRPTLLERAFTYLGQETLTEPQAWIGRIALLPEEARPRGAAALARSWAGQSPEEAMNWATSIADGETRHSVVAAAVSSWATKDAHGAAEWVFTLPAGPERERHELTLVMAMAEKNGRAALDWMLAIRDASERDRIAADAIRMMAARDPTTARQWIEAVPFTPEMKTRVLSMLEPTPAITPSQAASPR